MDFKQYVKLMKEAAENATSQVIQKSEYNKDGLIRERQKSNPNVWTCRIIDDEKFLFYQGKSLNITELKKAITDYYTAKGFCNWGFSKLAEEDIVRYSAIKNILKEIFTQSIVAEIDPSEVAEILFGRERFDYTVR